MTRKRATAVFSVALAIFLVPVAGWAQARFTTIDYPGATATVATGLNAQGDIVGTYVLAGVSHAFFLGKNDKTPVAIDADACGSDAWGINEAGDIVGGYVDCSSRKQYGYLLRHGVFTRIDVPGSTFTSGFGVNAEGDVVGHFGVSPSGRMNGFLLRNGTFTTYANAVAEAADKMTCGVGVGPGDAIVGHYQDAANLVHGFLLTEAGFTEITIPGGKNVQAYGISPEGEIAGFYTDLIAKRPFGFVRDQWGGLTTGIDVPGSISTTVRRNNARGDLVGAYTDEAGKQHGWVLRR